MSVSPLADAYSIASSSRPFASHQAAARPCSSVTTLRPTSLELGEQHLPEEVVVPERAARVVQGDDEEVLEREPLEHRSGIGALEDGVAQRPRHRLEHGAAQEKLGLVRARAAELLASQVVGHELVAAAERGDRRVASREREGGEVEAGGPPLGVPVQLGRLRRGELDAGLRQQLRVPPRRSARGPVRRARAAPRRPSSWRGRPAVRSCRRRRAASRPERGAQVRRARRGSRGRGGGARRRARGRTARAARRVPRRAAVGRSPRPSRRTPPAP